jgi:hypothetical protein
MKAKRNSDEVIRIFFVDKFSACLEALPGLFHTRVKVDVQ